MTEGEPGRETDVTSFQSGFLWRIDVQGGAQFSQGLILGLRDAFREVGRLHAGRMEHPPLALTYAQKAEQLARRQRGLLGTNTCTLPLEPLPVPSGGMGYLHLSAWPALRAALEQRGIVADGPAPAPEATPASRAGTGRRQAPSLHVRFFFDPALVGPFAESWRVDRPPASTALELGLPVAEGMTMAGINYLSAGRSGVQAWSAALADPADAWDAGGQPPIWIGHRACRALPSDFARTLGTAVAEAVGALRVHEPEAVTADLRVAVCDQAAVVRIGPQAGAVVRGGAYRRFVQQLAAALGRAGVPAAAMLEPRHLHPVALEELVPDAAAFVVCPDWDASVTRLVELRQTSPAGQSADALQAECRRLSTAAWGSASPPIVAWLPEPASPLFGRTPPPVTWADLMVYVSADAALPTDGAHQAEAWLDLALNGGKHGLDRALSEVRASRHMGAVALARALSARQLQRALPVSRRTSLDALRLACSQQLAGFGRLATRPDLARAVREILLASVRRPKVATDLVLTVQELLARAGPRLPLVAVFGARDARLLPVVAPNPLVVELARDLVGAGYEEDLETIWADNPVGILPPRHVDGALPALLAWVAEGTDAAALAAFARWAMQDAASRRQRGVRGMAAYVTVAEPRLRVKGIQRVFFLRETDAHVIALCDSAEGGRALLRLPRSGDGWDGWARPPGGALLAAYLAGAYRDMVVPLDVEPFAEEIPSAPTAGAIRLEPVGYLPARRRPRRRGPAGLVDRLRPAPHQVTWYIRRLAPGQRAHPEALARAAAVGMTVLPGYTFVDTYFWPRATDPRSAATALRITVAVSSLRALLQSATVQPPGLVADEGSRRNGSPHLSTGADDSARAESEPGAPPPGSIPPAPRRRPWWAFWRR